MKETQPDQPSSPRCGCGGLCDSGQACPMQENASTSPPTALPLVLPLDDEVRWILGRPNFWCGSIAEQLRRVGREIARKAEDEQAAVIHWFLCLYFEHGAAWRDVAADELRQMEHS